ncbi:MAG: endonuclease/exonuclease/phosphatase family protein [Saezia sp.]
MKKEKQQLRLDSSTTESVDPHKQTHHDLAPPDEKLLLRVATYNIHKGVRGMGPTVRAEYQNLAQAIKDFDADLIFLQEVRKQYHDKNIDKKLHLSEPQASLFAPEGYISNYMTNAYTQKGQHGNALLSRWPVYEMMREDISNSRFEQRGLLHVKILIGSQTLHCIVVHLSLLQTSRNWQQQKLISLIHRSIPAKDPVLIAGDFNDWNDKLLLPMQEVGFTTFETPPDATFPSFAPMLRLDRIYARGLTPLGAYVPKGKIWTRMSDHLPIIGEFVLDAPKATQG